MINFILAVLMFLSFSVESETSISVTGELQALKTDSYSPPRVRGIWQYTIAFMAEDGSVVKQGMPVLMFKTDAIQTKLIDAQGQLGIKQSTLKNQSVNNIETFENKKIIIEEKRWSLIRQEEKLSCQSLSLLKTNITKTN